MDIINQIAELLHLDSGRVALLTVLIALLGRAFAALRQGGGLVGLWRSVVYGQSVPKVIADDYKAELAAKSSASSDNAAKLSSLAILFLAGTLAIVGTFGLSGCATLDPSGSYKGDKALYVADTTLVTAYDVLDRFVTFEYQHRDALAGQPSIRQAADNIRANAPRWFQDAIISREAYAAHPVSANLTALQNSVRVIQAAIQTASGYLITNSQPTK